MDSELLKQFLVNGVSLGYDVNDLIEQSKYIKNEDDITNCYMNFRKKGEIRDCYYKTVSLDEIIKIIESCNGFTKRNFLISVKRKLKGIE